MEQDIRNFIENYEIPIETVPADRQYWFLRTEGGLYYKDFFHNNFIAIGYNEFINPMELLSIDRKIAFDLIRDHYPETKPGKIYNQIERFYVHMKSGDVVMIPGLGSNTVAFGIIESDAFILKDIPSGDKCKFTKRRKVRWIKEVNRRSLNPYLYPMIRPHNAISNANEYGHYIDLTLHDFYIKGTNTHFIIDVKTENNISIQEIRDLIDGVYRTIDIVNELGISEKQYTHNDIKIKMNVQSPGIVELISDHWQLMMLAGGVIGVIFGVKFSFLGLSLETDGIKGFIEKLMQQRHESKMKEIDHSNERRTKTAETTFELEKLDRSHQHELEKSKMERIHELEKMALEHAYLKEKLALQFPNEKAPSDEGGAISNEEKKSE